MRTSLLPLFAALALTAGCGSDGGGSETPKAALPEILSFTIEPSTVEFGGTVTLTWSASGADTLAVKDAKDASRDLGAELSGSIVITPTESTTYTLWAYNAAGYATSRPVAVRVIDTGRPRIQISANPTKITLGESSTLTWSVAGASGLILREGSTVLDDAAPIEGSLSVQPERTTTYHADAEGPGGSETKAVKIEVIAAIDSFTAASDGPVVKGTSVELSWAVRGADRIVLSNLDDYEEELDADMLESGNASAPVGTSGAFRLTAFRSGAQSTATARVDLLHAPKIVVFEPSAPFVTAASADNPIEIVIGWQVAGADSISVATSHGDPILVDSSDPTGSITVEVHGTTRFVMTATNEAGETTREAQVTSVAAPAVNLFEASRHLVGANDPLRLSWKTTGAVGVDLLANGVISAGAIAAEGGIDRLLEEDTVFILRATNAAGTAAEQEIMVEVGPPEIDAFGAEPDGGPAGSEIRLEWSVRGATAVGIVDEFGALVGNCLAGPDQLDDGECVATLPPGEGEFEWVLLAQNNSGLTVEPVTLDRWEDAP